MPRLSTVLQLGCRGLQKAIAPHAVNVQAPPFSRSGLMLADMTVRDCIERGGANLNVLNVTQLLGIPNQSSQTRRVFPISRTSTSFLTSYVLRKSVKEACLPDPQASLLPA